MKGRFITFVYDEYEREGGWNDILRAQNDSSGEPLSFMTQSEAFRVSADIAKKKGWSGRFVIQVVDLTTGKIVGENKVSVEVRIEEGPRTVLLP